MFPNTLMCLVFISSRALLKAQAMDMLISHVTVYSSTEKRGKNLQKANCIQQESSAIQFFLNQ